MHVDAVSPCTAPPVAFDASSIERSASSAIVAPSASSSTTAAASASVATRMWRTHTSAELGRRLGVALRHLVGGGAGTRCWAVVAAARLSTSRRTTSSAMPSGGSAPASAALAVLVGDRLAVGGEELLVRLGQDERGRAGRGRRRRRPCRWRCRSRHASDVGRALQRSPAAGRRVDLRRSRPSPRCSVSLDGVARAAGPGRRRRRSAAATADSRRRSYRAAGHRPRRPSGRRARGGSRRGTRPGSRRRGIGTTSWSGVLLVDRVAGQAAQAHRLADLQLERRQAGLVATRSTTSVRPSRWHSARSEPTSSSASAGAGTGP